MPSKLLGSRMSHKKIVILVVEGISDKLALSHCLNSFVSDRNIVFVPFGEDITANTEYIGSDHLDILVNEIINFAQDEEKFEISDIIEVVQLVDTDGVYCPDSCVVQSREPISRPIYYPDRIEVSDVHKMLETRNQKRDVLRYLLTQNRLCFPAPYSIAIPFSLYFMSSNLDHVLYGIQNLPGNQKRLMAEDFSFQYYRRIIDFVSLIDSLNSSGSYDLPLSWKYIQESCHSLEPGTNLIIYLRKLNLPLVESAKKTK